MKIDEIVDLIEKDSVIDIANLDYESVKIAILHSKWYKILISELKILKGLEIEISRLKRSKFEYYLGKAPDEEYKQKPLHHKILKSDIEIYLEGDDDMISIKNKHEAQKLKLRAIEDFIKQINQRSFNIRNAIEFQKFKNGVN